MPKTNKKKSYIDSDSEDDFFVVKKSKRVTSAKKEKVQKQLKEKKEKKQKVAKEEEESKMVFQDIYDSAETQLPSFLQSENVMDNQQRRPSDPDYDPTTIYIPPNYQKKLSPMFRQYWNAKQVNFDKIIFFRYGRWFHLFYKDAIIAAQLFNQKICFWGSDRPCIQIYESSYPLYVRGLNERGYGIAIVEQYGKNDGEEDQVSKREISCYLTAGTTQEGEVEYDSRYLMSIIEANGRWGVAMVDVTTNQFLIDQLDDVNRLKKILYECKPLEVVLSQQQISDNTIKMTRYYCNPIVQMTKKELKPLEEIFVQLKAEFESNQEDKHRMDGYQQVDVNEGVFQDSNPQPIEIDDTNPYPDFLQELEKQYHYEKSKDQMYSYTFAVQALYLLVYYLRTLMQSETVYKRGSFNFYYESTSYLQLDSSALATLEVFQVNLQTKVTEQGSLFHYLNHCGSSFGKRLLRRWVSKPLVDKKSIVERQECVQSLIENLESTKAFIAKIRELPDLERSVVRIYNTISAQKLKQISNNSESQGYKRFKELSNLLDQLVQGSKLVKILDLGEETRLQRLTTSSGEGGLFPDIDEAIENLKKHLVIVEGQPQPTKGLCKEYDEALGRVKDLEKKLEEERKYWEKKLGVRVKYFHGRMRYQLEMEDGDINSIQKPQELVISSKKKGFQRFQTEKTEELVEQLKVKEQQLQKSLMPFLKDYFVIFYSYRSLWHQMISCLSELDCLCSLAVASTQMASSCTPSFWKDARHEFKLTAATHPCMKQWVPNTVHFPKSLDIILLTGPNMSGKSSLLRLIGVHIILAQIGCNVPAKKFAFQPFDQIFCRLGARDELQKSTFYVELEETVHILKSATRNSLVIIDELGRGTSTYDGVAIASSVLKYLSKQIQCKGVFATHYQILVDEFKLHRNVKAHVMKHKYDGQQVKFFYQLEAGQAEKSFACNVAKMAGLPEEVIHKSSKMEQMVRREEENVKKNRKVQREFNDLISQLIV